MISKIRSKIISIMILIVVLSYPDSYSNNIPDMDSVFNKICQEKYNYKSYYRHSILFKLLPSCLHLTIEDFFCSNSDNSKMGMIPLLAENDIEYLNSSAVPWYEVFNNYITWKVIYSYYDCYPKVVIGYFKEAKFVVSVNTLLSGSHLSVTVSLENFKVLDKYTAYLYTIADYTYRFEYSCESKKWIFSDIEKMFYTEPKKQVMHPIGAKYDDGK